MAHVDLTITARKPQVQAPIVWQLCREFDVKVNIVRAAVDEDMGWVHLNLEGAVEEIQRATAWLMTTGAHIEAEQRAVGAI